LVHAARQWHKKFEEKILKLSFRKNEVDPCIFYKQEGTKFCLLCLYVDDSIITGDENLMNQTIRGLNQVFKLKIQKDILGFLA